MFGLIIMQPYNRQGKKIRFAFVPFSFAIAGLTVYFVLILLSKINGTGLRELLQTDSLWPLVVFLPGFFFGKVLGLMMCNCFAYVVPPIRRIFEQEVAKTGRHDFTKAMKDLSKVLAILGALTILGSFVFLKSI